MMRYLLVLFVLALLLPIVAAAQEPEPFYAIAPVQVEVMAVDEQWSYDCYPSCLLYTSPSPRDRTRYRMPSSA